jgi:hypothetical protein
MSKARGTTPSNPRRVRKNAWEHARLRARGTTPLNPRRVRNNAWEHAR